MPTEIWPRKLEKMGYLNAVYQNSYVKPKVYIYIKKKTKSKYQKMISLFIFSLNIVFIVKIINQ